MLATLGREITKREYDHPVIFLRGPSGFGHALSSFLSIFQRSTEAPGPTPSSASRFTIRPEDYPFLDLFTFPEERSFDFGRETQRKWLETISAIVVVSYGRDASSNAASDFLHPYGLSDAGFHLEVGSPRIIRYAPTEWIDDFEVSDVPEVGKTAILVPCYDPGYLKHGQGNYECVRQMIVATLEVGLVLASHAAGLVLDDIDHDSIVEATLSWYQTDPDTRKLRSTPSAPPNVRKNNAVTRIRTEASCEITT